VHHAASAGISRMADICSVTARMRSVVSQRAW
jgi:hypothetical protein